MLAVLASARVVVIDDHDAVGRALAYVLCAHGWRVDLARNGAAGLELVLRAQPDIVLVDIVLPDTDGWSIARAVRALPFVRRPRLIALSAFNTPDDHARSREAGFEAHLAKPFALDELVCALRRNTADAN